MFEQRRFPAAKERLPEKMQKGLAPDAVVVMIEPTDRPSDQLGQKFLYESVGFEKLHKDDDGLLFMVGKESEAKAYAEAAGRESRQMLEAKPGKEAKVGDLKNETDTVEQTLVNPLDLLDDAPTGAAV